MYEWVLILTLLVNNVPDSQIMPTGTKGACLSAIEAISSVARDDENLIGIACERVYVRQEEDE